MPHCRQPSLSHPWGTSIFRNKTFTFNNAESTILKTVMLLLAPFAACVL